MSARQLIEAFDAWRDAGEQMVLATVTETEGSTYSKPGAQMLISGSGQFRGLLSGGCLEGDLVEHAKDVLAHGLPRTVRYDMRNRDEDQLWGLGLGCDGAIDIFLQALDGDCEPYAAIARRIKARIPSAFALVLESSIPGLATGAIALVNATSSIGHAVPERALASLARVGRERLEKRGAGPAALEIDGGTADVLAAVIPIPVHLLVLGGGPDAVPLVRIARELGWYVTVGDHRRGYVERMRASADTVREVAPADLAQSLDPNAYDAAVIMSHHLQSDRGYLRALAGSRVPYIGLLGPRARRERLLSDLGEQAGSVATRLYGPVGLDIGADTPQGIALAIAAEIHLALKGARATHESALAGGRAGG